VISDSTKTEIDVASLTMRPLTHEEMDAYIATGEWQGCAGGYRIEGKGRALFARIDGDLTSIQGLPLALLRRMLRRP
jgi:septum formation protein